MADITKLKVGQVLYDVQRSTMGNTSLAQKVLPAQKPYFLHKKSILSPNAFPVNTSLATAFKEIEV